MTCEVLLDSHHISVHAALMVVGTALNLPVLNAVCTATTPWHDVPPLSAIAARPFTAVAEVACISMRERYLHFHLA